MKWNRGMLVSVKSGILAAALFFLMVGAANALEVRFVIGDVSLARQGATKKLDVAARVVSGDVIVTGKGGVALLAYDDGSEIKIMENSRVRIGSDIVKNSSSVSVLSGVVNAKFQKLRKGSEKKVYTPTTVCSVRGTDFLVGVSDGAESRVDMNEGALDVHNPYGAVRIESSQKSEIGVGESPKQGVPDTDLNDWKAANDAMLAQGPEKKADAMSAYVGKLGDNNARSGNSINSFQKRLSSKGIKDRAALEKAGADLDSLSGGIEDEAMLGEALESSIDGILVIFGSEKESIRAAFEKVREESNAVREQQRINYEALQAVRESYRKAYDSIMKGHKEYRDKIKGSVDRGAVTPPRL